MHARTQTHTKEKFLKDVIKTYWYINEGFDRSV